MSAADSITPTVPLIAGVVKSVSALFRVLLGQFPG